MHPDPKPLRIIKRILFRALTCVGPPRRMQIRAAGITMEMQSTNLLAENIFANAFERDERTVLSKLLEAGDLAVDVGANIGFYSCLFGKRVGSAGKVIALEPTPNAYAQLQQNVTLNDLKGIVECRNVAASDKNGSISLNSFDSGLEAYNSAGASSSYGKTSKDVIAVRAETLDSILGPVFSAAPPKSCVVKIDVEGFESAVLQGARSILGAAHNISLMVELCGPLALQCGFNVQDSLALMQSLGYSSFAIAPHQKLREFVGEETKCLEQKSLNIFFCKANAIEKLADQHLICRNA